jgi:phosphoserine aminotransferase
MTRKFNFYAGPAVIPFPVLEQIEKEMKDYKGIGLSLIETSHRSKEYEEVHNAAMTLLKELLKIPNHYQILFLGGGATMQFGMIPLNFLTKEKSCDFTLTGSWAEKAYKDAKKIGKVNVVFDGKSDKYMKLPAAATLKANPDSVYLHMTSNETIGGIEWPDWPDTGKVPIFADMSSDIMSRPLPIEKFGLIYAGAQKNLGPAGVTVVIIRQDLLALCPDTLPAYLNYNTHAKDNSLYNTPPVFSIYALKLVLEWVKNQGGVNAMKALADKRASMLYQVIDESNGYYSCPVDKASRSKMNIVWRLPSEEKETKFVDEAKKLGMLGLKGHKSVGGCRASIYNAMPVEGVMALADFMKDFQKKN